MAEFPIFSLLSKGLAMGPEIIIHIRLRLKSAGSMNYD
jgi:hypothetical protein